jgi:hypothetical protein
MNWILMILQQKLQDEVQRLIDGVMEIATTVRFYSYKYMFTLTDISV